VGGGALSVDTNNLKPILIKVHVVKMFNEAPKTIASFARVQEISFVPDLSYGCGLFRDGGGPNRLFFTFLFFDKALSIAFLKEAKLIRSEVLCETCGRLTF